MTRVIIDEGIILTNTTPNKFDQLICPMISGKGSDNVRKSGDFTIIARKEHKKVGKKQVTSNYN